mmetsp:Transcript_65691/g.155604  ORF Transcript_65691/g.155604 Transcript_65691/m.155604 type:complete len:205 (-) Transcript_65691:283-897(-)
MPLREPQEDLVSQDSPHEIHPKRRHDRAESLSSVQDEVVPVPHPQLKRDPGRKVDSQDRQFDQKRPRSKRLENRNVGVERGELRDVPDDALEPFLEKVGAVDEHEADDGRDRTAPLDEIHLRTEGVRALDNVLVCRDRKSRRNQAGGRAEQPKRRQALIYVIARFPPVEQAVSLPRQDRRRADPDPFLRLSSFSLHGACLRPVV